MKKQTGITVLIFCSLIFSLFFLTACDKNYQYAFLAKEKTYLDTYVSSVREIADRPELISDFPNKSFNPEIYSLGRIFKDYKEIEDFFINLYGAESKYKNEEQFKAAEETGVFIVNCLDSRVWTFMILDNGIQLIAVEGNLDFSEVFNNYDRNDYKTIEEIYNWPPEPKYYSLNDGIYKFTFYNGGHLLIGLKRIEYIVLL